MTKSNKMKEEQKKSQVHSQPRLVLLPGLGADERLFRFQSRDIPQVVTPKWIPAQPKETLASYARRFAESLDFDSELDFLGGMSFGGQVALKLAPYLKPRAIFLIAAHRRSDEISPAFIHQAKILTALPEMIVRAGLRSTTIPAIFLKEKLPTQVSNDLTAMLDDMDFDFFKWSTHAAATWEYEFDPSKIGCRVHQIHGTGDEIIPVSRPEEVHWVEGARHLIVYTHANEVNTWLKQKMKI